MDNEESTPSYDPSTATLGNLNVPKSNEYAISEIRRHPIGIIIMYAMSGIVLVVVALLVFGVIPAITGSRFVRDFAVIFLLFTMAGFGIYSYMFTKTYWGNVWILFTDSMTQIVQTSIYDRQTNRVPLDIIEDVTAVKAGYLSSLIDYGQLSVEISGQQDKLVFNYCPSPNYYAHEILAAREDLKQKSQVETYNQPLAAAQIPEPVPVYYQPPAEP